MLIVSMAIHSVSRTRPGMTDSIVPQSLYPKCVAIGKQDKPNSKDISELIGAMPVVNRRVANVLADAFKEVSL